MMSEEKKSVVIQLDDTGENAIISIEVYSVSLISINHQTRTTNHEAFCCWADWIKTEDDAIKYVLDLIEENRPDLRGLDHQFFVKVEELPLRLPKNVLRELLLLGTSIN